MNKETGNMEVAPKTTSNALSTISFEDDAGQGLGNLSHEDLALPFLKVLGQLSPEINERDGKYVQGSKPGMIYNSVTGELFDGEKGVDVIPCHYKLEYVEWQDRGQGGGAPVAIHPSSSDIMSQTKRDASWKDRLPNGNYIEKTASHFLIVSGASSSTALLTMKSTQLKVSRKWNSMMQSIQLEGKNGLYNPASFSHVYKLKTVKLTNNKGTWFGWEVKLIGEMQDKALYQKAKAFSASVSKGDIVAKHGEPAETQEKQEKGIM